MLLVLDRARRRWWVPVLVAAVLGWALVGDSLVLLIGVAPLVVVCGARAFGLLALRGQPLAVAWYDLSLAAAGLAAVVGGTALSALIKTGGGFVLSPSATQSTVPSTALPANAAATVNDFLGLFSADFFGARLNAWLAVTAVHLVFACLVARRVVRRAARVPPRLPARRPDRAAAGGRGRDQPARLPAALPGVRCPPCGRSRRSSGSAARWPAGCWASRCCGGGLAPLLALGAVAARRRAAAAAADGQAGAARRGQPGAVPGRPRPEERAGGLLERRQHDARQPRTDRHRAGQVPPGAGAGGAPVGDRHPAVRQQRPRRELPRRHRRRARPRR